MRDRPLLFLLSFTFFLVPLTAPAGAADAKDHITRLIARLGSGDFAERELVTKELEALGQPALPALQAASHSPDAEVARRAEQLVRHIENRLLSERVLAPSRIRLIYKDTPVTEAVDDFARKTGFSIELRGDRAGLAVRKLTMDTGDVAFWAAFDQFCRDARLTEMTPSTFKRTDTTRFSTKGGAFRIVDDGRTPSRAPESRLVLADGAAPQRPTCHAGALRIRAVPVNVATTGKPRSDSEVLLILEALHEPRLQWQNVVTVRIERAIDDLGQDLVQAHAPLNPVPENAVEFFLGNANAAIVNNVILWESTGELSKNLFDNCWELPVRLRLAKQPSTTIKELRGMIAAQVRTAPEPLVTVDNILRATGETINGLDGSTLKVTDIRKDDQGRIKVCFQVEQAPADLETAGLGAVRVLRINRGLRKGIESSDAARISLLDDKGQHFRLGTGDIGTSGTGLTQEYNVTFEPQPSHGEPAKLVFAAPRTVIVEVPFTLLDVPLPK